MKTSEAIAGNELRLLNYFGLPEVTGNRHYRGECPICGKKNKFRLNWYNGHLTYICVCGNGSLINLIMESKGMDFATAARQIDEVLGVKSENNVVKRDDYIVDNFMKYTSIKGTQAQDYLNSRGIFDLPKKGVRWAESISDFEYGDMSAMVAIAVDDGINPCYEHRTYIDGGIKADVEKQKKLNTIQKSHGGCAVRLFDVGEVMGIAEGIETALSANQLYKVPTWSTLNSGFMKKFKAPVGVKTLYIYADNDYNGTGLAAAFECGNKNLLSGNDVDKVVIQWPEKDGDFNDVLVSDMQVMKWELINE